MHLRGFGGLRPAGSESNQGSHEPDDDQRQQQAGDDEFGPEQVRDRQPLSGDRVEAFQGWLGSAARSGERGFGWIHHI